MPKFETFYSDAVRCDGTSRSLPDDRAEHSFFFEAQKTKTPEASVDTSGVDNLSCSSAFDFRPLCTNPRQAAEKG